MCKWLAKRLTLAFIVLAASVTSALAQQILTGGIRTQSGRFLTAVGGGGLGGPNSGPGATALHSDATTPSTWETFSLVWTNRAKCEFALRTANGDFITAVNGGAVGGPNDSRSPFHTDARAMGAWEKFELILQPDLQHAFLRTANGYFITAVNGGGLGGPNDVPIHTDATQIGVWERFVFVSSTPISCERGGSTQTAKQLEFEHEDNAAERLANQIATTTPTMIKPNHQPTRAQIVIARSANIGAMDAKDTFTVGLVDLNDDGKPDLIIHSTNHDNCGSAGCSANIIMATKNEYSTHPIPLPYFSESLTVLPSVHLGMHDLSFDRSSYVFRWNGKSYD